MAEPLALTLRRLDEEDEAERARTNVATLTDQNPDEAAAERATPARMRDMEILAQSPRLRRYLSSASNAALAHDDLPALSVFERVNDIGVLAMDIYAGGNQSRTGREIAQALDFDGAWEQGERNIEAARLANRDNPVTASVARDGFRPLDAAGRRRLDVLDARPRRQYGIVGQVIEQLPQIAGSFEAGGRRAVRDVRQSWRQVYGDEPRPLNFNNAVAATVLAPVAGVSAVISAVGGTGRGIVGFTYEQEAGAAYQEYRRLVDVDGNQLSPEIAGEAARNVGMINAGVEFIGLGGAARVAGVSEVVQRLSNGAVRGALRRQGYLWATRRLATGVAGAGLSEGFTELTQEGVTIAFGEMARQQQGGEWEDLNPDEVAERAWEAFRMGATVGAVLGSVPAGARFDGDIRAVRDARLQEEVFAALAEGSEGSRLKGRSLGAFADAVNTLTANGPLAEVRIDANRFVSFYQDQEIDAHAAADALKGVGAEALDRALATGGEISIPMGTYQAQIVGTPSYDGLTPHIRLGPDKLTPAEVRARLELGVDIERATAEATRMQGEANVLRKRVDAVETRIAAQFDEAGFIPQAQRAFVKAYASHVVNMAQRAGVDPETMLDRVGFSLRGPLDARKSDVDAIVDGVIERIESAAADIPRNGFPRDGLGVARPRETAERFSARASDADGTLTTSWGATLNYRAGDMIVGEAQGEARPVRADIFAATYEETAPGEFGKRADAVVGYFVLRAARTIKTLEGPVKAEAGDVVLVGAAGEMWPIKRAKFDDRYQVIGDGQLYQDPPAIHPTALRFGTEEEIAELLDLVSMGADIDEVLAHPIMVRVQAHAETLEQTLPLSEKDNPDALDDYDYAVNGRSVGFKTMLKDALRVARSYGEVGTDRVATIVIGNFAAGKSTFIKKLAAGTRAAVVDADQVKSYIPFYEDGYNTGATGAESSAIRWKVRDALMRKGENIVIEHVGDNPSSVIKSKTEMEEEGYTVTVVHVKVEPHEATRRATRRFIETGRYIEPNATRRVVEKELVTAAFNSLVAKGEIDAYIEVDATPPPRQAVVLRAKGAKLQAEAIADALRGVRRDAGLGDEGVQGSREGGSNQEVNDDWKARLSVAQNEQGDWQVVDQSGERQSDHVFSERAGADLALENMRYGRRELDGALDQSGPNQGPRGSATFERNAAGVMTSVVMDLFEARNLSTPIHEFGHIFLETLRMVASDEGASAQTKKDWATALEWMGLTDEQWSQYSKLPPQEATNALRVYHEQFARGFEAYVREGKAPSMALRDVFAQFKRWLLSLYESMAELRVELTPQIREVFDRLLASDEAIAEAQAAAGADKPLTREQFGGKGKAADAQYARYVKHFDRARAEAAEEIDKAAIGALMADRTRWYRSRERQVRKAEEINFDSRPEQRAHQWLAYNVWRHGTPPAGLDPIRLSPASLIEDYGQDFINRLPKGLVTPDVDGLVEQVRLVRSELNKPAPKRLAEAISDLGGIKLVDAEGRGDIEAIIGTDSAVPVRGGMKRKLLSGTGRTLEGNGDDAGLIMALWEAGYFGAGPDSAGVFQLAGVNAATANMDLLAIARQLEGEGKSKGLIWNLTGWSRSPLHNDWQFEIDPDSVKVLANLATLGRSEKILKLDEVLDWPELYQAYPWLAEITVYFQKASPRVTEGGSYLGSAFNGLGAIWVTHPGGQGSSAAMLSVLRHEIQHAIQKHENWPQGYSWDLVRKDSPRWERTWKDRLERQAFWRQAVRGDATPTEADIQEAKDGAAFEIYMLEQGEVEARTVQGRAVASRETRRLNPPGSALDPEYIARTWRGRGFNQDGPTQAPRSLRGVTQMTDDEVVAWFNANVEVRRPNDAAVSLWFKTDDALARPNVRVSIDWGGHAVTTYRGRHAGERWSGPNAADVKKAAQMFVRLAAVMRAWLIIEKSERIYFTGATAAHERMYQTMLRVTNFPGYVSREETRRAASASKATENVTPIRTAQSTQNTNILFSIVRKDVAEKLQRAGEGPVIAQGNIGSPWGGSTYANVGTVEKFQTDVRILRDGQANPDGRASGGSSSGGSGPGAGAGGSDAGVVDGGQEVRRGSGGFYQDGEALGDGREIDVLGFFSAALEAAKALPSRAMDGSEIINRIAKARGVEGFAGRVNDEIKWLGLREEFGGREGVTRDEVVSYVETHRLMLSEAYNRFDPAKPPATPTKRKYLLEVLEPIAALRAIGGEIRWTSGRTMLIDAPFEVSRYVFLDHVADPNNERWEVRRGTVVNYETLQSIPLDPDNSDKSRHTAMDAALRAWMQENIARAERRIKKADVEEYMRDMHDAESAGVRRGPGNLRLPGDDPVFEIRLMIPAPLPGHDFKSHWSRAPSNNDGVVVSIRGEERRDDAGGRTLFGGEVQSDLAQSARSFKDRVEQAVARVESIKSGVLRGVGAMSDEQLLATSEFLQDGRPPPAIDPMRDPAALARLREAFPGEGLLWQEDKTGIPGLDELFAEESVADARVRQIMVWRKWSLDLAQAQSHLDAVRAGGESEGITSAPLTGSTSQWTGAGVRALVYRAVRDGFDSVSFPTGETSHIIQGNDDAASHYDTNVKGALVKVARAFGMEVRTGSVTFHPDGMDDWSDLPPESAEAILRNMWAQMPASVRVAMRRNLPNIRKLDDGSFIVKAASLPYEDGESGVGAETFDWTLKYDARGNPMVAAYMIWVQGAMIWNESGAFSRLLETAAGTGLGVREAFDAAVAKGQQADAYVMKITPEARATIMQRGLPLFQGERPTINEFKELLRRDLGGEHVYRLEDQERVEALEAATRMRDWFAERGVDIKAKAGELKKQIEAMAASVDDNGADADLAASIFGFDSGREMLEAIIDAPDRTATIDANTRKAMLDEYGDPFADGSIAEEARLAAHGAARAQVIELELDAMSRATGGAVRPLARLAKRIAEDQIGRMTVKQIRDYDWFLGNERRHGKEALEALARGNAQEAQMAKHRQLVNHYLYALARKASEETEVAQRYFRKFNSAGVRGNIDGEYLDQIDQLLEQYELRKITGAEIQRRISLTAWVASMEERGLGHMVNVDPAMLENARKIPFAQLQLDDLRGLVDTIRNIEHLGRLKDKLLDAADKRAFRDVVSDLTDTMETTGPISPEIRSNYSPTAIERTQDRMREAHAEMTRMEFLFRYLDGKANGPLWRTLWLPFARAADKESAMMHASAQKMSAIWDRYTPRERARMFKTRIPMTDLPVGAATSYTKAELLSIALNLGNDGNVQALVDGFAWAQQAQQRGAEIDYQAVKDQIIASLNRQLNERDWQTVQQIWDLIGEFRDEAFQLQEDLTGVRPEAVKAAPVQTPYGEIAGGYYPLKFDRARDLRVAKADAAQEVQERWGSNHFKPMTRKGHTINRVGSGGRPVKLSLTVVSEHVQNVVHDISYRRAVIDAERLISDSQFAETFVRVAGLPMYEQLMPWLQAIASDRVDPSAFMWKFLQKLRGNVAIAAMGYRISTGLQQITGLVQAIPMLGSVEMGAALVKLVGRPDQIAAKSRFILNRSEFMRSRIQTFDRDVRETIDRMERSDPLHPIRHHAFALVGVFDWGVSSVVWTAAYDKARAGKVAGIDATDEQAAVHYADGAVRTTQSAGLPQDLPAIMRTQQVNKLLTMFFSYFSVLYNWTAYDQVMGARKGRISPVAFMANMALIYVVSPMIAETLAGRLAPREDEDEEERNARLISVVARFPFQTVPVLRDIANAVGTGFEYQLSPAQSAPGQIAEAVQDIAAGRTFESEATTKRFVTAIGYAYGLPTPQAWVTVDYIADKLEGEEEGFDPYEAFVRDTR